MKKLSQSQIDDAVSGNYEFEMSKWISEGFRLTQQYLGGFIGIYILFFLISMVVGFIPIIGSVISNIVIAPALTAGVVLMAHRIDQERPYEFNDFFKGFDYIKDLAIIALIMIGLMVLCFLPMIFGFAGSGFFEFINDPVNAPEPQFSALFALGGLISIIPLIYLAVSYLFPYHFHLFGDLSGWEALETSRKTIGNKFGSFLLFIFVLSLINIAGVLVLCVGILFTIPATTIAMYAAFRDITRLNEDSEDDLSEHLVD